MHTSGTTVKEYLALELHGAVGVKHTTPGLEQEARLQLPDRQFREFARAPCITLG